ncbi:MAG: glycosyltransferase, partial [Burkholderiales bacterium]
MIVKDEQDTIEGCLAPILDLFSQVIVIDTGSSDRTCEILNDRFHIEPLRGALDKNNCYSKCGVRNTAFSMIETPWIVSLDADERISREDLKTLVAMQENPDVAGYFCRWDTRLNGAVTEDYKLPIFRKGLNSRGLVHENVQTDIRARGLNALWLEGFC